MDILWLKVSDEVEIPGCLSPIEQSRLAQVFDPESANSHWSRALRLLGMSQPGLTPIVRFVEGTPYFNGTALALASSNGTVFPMDENGQVSYKTRLGPLGLFRVLATQWKLEKFLSQENHPFHPMEESIALGLAIQALMMRLPSKSESEIAGWLASPDKSPSAIKATIQKVLALQSRRNTLTKHWNALFEAGEKAPANPGLPAFFWNEPPTTNSAPSLPMQNIAAPRQGTWKGIPVCPGSVEGELHWIELGQNPYGNASHTLAILGFAKAKPETTEYFASASALIFAEGGALSHACSIARERGIPCVSGLGRSFTTAALAWKNAGIRVRVSLNGSSGEVICSIIEE